MRVTRFAGKAAVALVAVVLLSTTAGLAQMHRHQMRHEGGDGFGPGFLMGRMVERLQLTEEQQEQIHAAMMEHHQTMDPLMDQLREAKQAVAGRIHAPELDEAGIREASAAAAALEADVAVERARALQVLRAQLTPEQQAELDVMLAEMGDSFGPGHGPGPGPQQQRRRVPGEAPRR